MAYDARIKERYPSCRARAWPEPRRKLRTPPRRRKPVAAHPLYYFFDTGHALQQARPGTGCGAIGGVNRSHAILGASEHCIATHPSDMAEALAALEAVVQVSGPNGDRSIPLSEFHRLPGDDPAKDTNLAQGEIIVAVDLPAPIRLPRTSPTEAA